MEYKEFIKVLNVKCVELQDSQKEIISDEVAFEAYMMISFMKFKTRGDYLLFISAINLLNSYVKQDGAKLSYHFKTYLEFFLKSVISNKVDFVKFNSLSDELGGYKIIQFDELQFSFHNVKLDIPGLDNITDEFLEWDKIKKQVCALTIYEMCKSDDLLTSNLTRYNGDLNSKLNKLVEDFKEGYIDFNVNLFELDMSEDEYLNFYKRYDKYIKYNLPYPLFDPERQVLEYVYKNEFNYFDKESEYRVDVHTSLIEALDDVAWASFYYSYNSKLYDGTVGHTHAHSFSEVVSDLYSYPESFSISEDDKQFYSEQELNYLKKVQKYLLFIGFNDQKSYKDKSRYTNELREKFLSASISTFSDQVIDKLIENKFYIFPCSYPEHFSESSISGTKKLYRNEEYDFRLYVEFTKSELKKYSDVKDIYTNDKLSDDDFVVIDYFDILEKY